LEIELKETENLRKSQRKAGGFISLVAIDSPAARIGIAPGDRLLAIDGRPVKDIVGVRYYQTENALTLKVLKQGETIAREFAIQKDYAEDIGIDFDDPTFDGIKRCNNHCLFCFVDQMAPRFRHSLYIKDDDYRYSFLYGNFVTMTNLKEEDWQRIDEERLTPLYFSVHATEMECRRYIMGNPRVPDPIEQLRKMESLDIQAHTQIVLCPDVNDGTQLERSVRDLAAMYPTVQSIGIVPVGLTKYRTRYNEVMRSYTPEEARAVIAQVAPMQKRLKKEIGKTLVHLSDEWYLLTGSDLPKAASYDGFVQLENGVGMVRQLVDDHARTLRRLHKKLAANPPAPIPLAGAGWAGRGNKRIRLVTATMIGPLLQKLTAELNSLPGIEADVLVLENELFGPQVTVAGLLTGGQVVRAVQEAGTAGLDALFIPDTMFSITEPHRTLDELTLEQINEQLAVPVYPAQSFSEVVDFLGVL